MRVNIEPPFHNHLICARLDHLREPTRRNLSSAVRAAIFSMLECTAELLGHSAEVRLRPF